MWDGHGVVVCWCCCGGGESSGTHEFGGVVKVEGGDDVHALVQVKLKDPGVGVLVMVKPPDKVVD